MVPIIGAVTSAVVNFLHWSKPKFTNSNHTLNRSRKRNWCFTEISFANPVLLSVTWVRNIFFSDLRWAHVRKCGIWIITDHLSSSGGYPFPHRFHREIIGEAYTWENFREFQRNWQHVHPLSAHLHIISSSRLICLCMNIRWKTFAFPLFLPTKQEHLWKMSTIIV